MFCLTPKNENKVSTVVPRYRIEETAEAYVITAAVPGVDKSQIETRIENDQLIVEAQRQWTPPKDWTPVHRESSRSNYRLVLGLDHRLNRDAVKAELAQGILTLNVPKADVVKPRKIAIES